MAVELDYIFSGSSPEPGVVIVASPEAKAESAETKIEPVVVKTDAEVKTEAAVEKKSEEKVEAKAETVDEKKLETIKINWESDENPLKAKLAETEKRLKDTRDWDTRVNQENVEVKRQLAILNKKLDGTYDPEKDEKPVLTPEQAQDEGEIRGKVRASEVAAYALYGGKDAVEATLKEFDKQFGENQLVQMRVLYSETPVIEAIKVMRETAFIKKHGTDPEKIEENIRKSVIQELETSITEKVTKQIMASLNKKESLAPTLTGVRGAGEKTEKGQTGPTPLSSIFSH